MIACSASLTLIPSNQRLKPFEFNSDQFTGRLSLSFFLLFHYFPYFSSLFVFDSCIPAKNVIILILFCNYLPESIFESFYTTWKHIINLPLNIKSAIIFYIRFVNLDLSHHAKFIKHGSWIEIPKWIYKNISKKFSVCKCLTYNLSI